MIINMTGGAGGSGLNFKVVQYRSVPTEPAKENTIAVIVPNVISNSVNWVMQAEQPTGTDGLVWIEVATESDVAFYADKKETVKLYPKSVKQYVEGAWANREAYVYQNGVWVIFSTEAIILYKYGSVGSASSWAATTNASTAGGIGDFAEDANAGGLSVTCAGGGSSARGGDLYLVEKKDLTEVKTIKAKIKRSVTDGSEKMWLFANETVYNDRVASPTFDASTLVSETYDDFTEISVSVESLSGEKYLGFYLYCSSGDTQTIVISEFSME